MERKNVIKLITTKHKMGSILIIAFIAILLLLAMGTLAETIIEKAIIEDEKTIIRTAAATAKGENASNIINVNTFISHFAKYIVNQQTTVEQPSSDIIRVTFAKTGNVYEINIITGPTFDDAGGTMPYLPVGYSAVEGTNLVTGFVIEDELGNQYVWVEVPKTTEVYQTAGLNITTFTNEEFEKIEDDLHEYTSVYRSGSSYVDEYYSDEVTGLTSSEYTSQKKKMLKSIYKHGGFYVGRYETGIDGNWRIDYSADKDISEYETPVIKQNMYPYNNITTSRAQELSESFATEGYTSSLMFGVQWDLILKYLETKGVPQAELSNPNVVNLSWGNMMGTLYTITNTNAKYSIDYGVSWNQAPYTKTSSVGESSLLTTGASDDFCKQNIYDLAGNVSEKTLEQRTGYNISRGDCHDCGEGFKDRSEGDITDCEGFRVALYKDEGTGAEGAATEPTYIPEGYTHVSGTDMDTGYVIEDASGNQYVWVEVPKTEAVYQTAGLGITEYTAAEFEKIENDLRIYTSVYREGYGEYYDSYISDDATGLTYTQYYTQKKKMLKSIYKNGGFYVGRYETGIEGTYRTASGDATQTPVIKQNAYPYNYVTPPQAQELSERFATEGYTSSLMFGVQWDLVLKYLETKGTSQAELITDSSAWGNMYIGTYVITSSNAKCTSGEEWTEAPNEKSENTARLLTTGASDKFSKQNISDLAGNLRECTLSANSSKIIFRGNYYWGGYTYAPEKAVVDGVADNVGNRVDYGFRTCLYKDEGTGTEVANAQPYIPDGYTQVPGTDLGTGLVVRDEDGNEFVWVEVPRTTSTYPTAGTNITTFTEDAYEKIENDLHTYTSVYRNGTMYADEYYSSNSTDSGTGLTRNEYYAQKRKMLKSIYKYQGFYVGRYETGTLNHAETTTVIKQNVNPYNIIGRADAQELSETFATEGYTSSLMFGVQWDLMLKYLETKGIARYDLISDSSDWGNYDSAGYFSTGSKEEYSKQNIYDIAGNIREFTLEFSGNESYPISMRGGFYDITGSTAPAYDRYNLCGGYYTGDNNGFRTCLYKEDWGEMDNYMRYYTASDLDGAGTTGVPKIIWKDMTGNYNGRIYGEPTFGNGYVSINEGSSTESQYVDIGPMNDVDVITIDLKFSIKEIGVHQYLLGNWGSGGFGIFVTPEGKIGFQAFAENDAAYKYAYGTTTLQANTIYECKAVYDGTYIYVYLNGTLEAKVQTGGGKIKNVTGGENVFIGGNPAVNNDGIDWTDRVAKIKIYEAKISPFVNHP